MMKKLIALFLICALGAAVLAGCAQTPADPTDPKDTSGSEGDSQVEEGYTHRVILLSDTHYMSDESKRLYEALYPGSNASDAVGDAFGYTQTEKMQAIRDDIALFMEDNTVDAVLTLGDLATDDYGYRNLAHNFGLKYKEEVMDTFPCPAYALPGNHDSYPNDMWYEMFGYDRQFSVKIGDAAFIMLDTYPDTTTASASGVTYAGIDSEWLEQELEKYPTEQIFICTHYVEPDEYDYAFNKILKENDRIVCVFMGHSHGNELLLPEGLDHRWLINVSGYAYKSEKVDGTWQFDRFDEKWAWGFGVLEWNDTEAHYYHVKYPRTYIGRNGTFDYAGAIEDEVTIKFK